MDATATVNEQNAEGELQANPDMLLISKPKADWSVRDFRDSIEELASVEAADILLTGDASVALLRKAGLVNDPTGPNPNAYTIDPRFNGLTAEDAKRMRQNAGKYAKALKGYRTSMKRISASGPVQVSYRIGGVLYIEEAHVSPSGEFTPAAYLAKVPDAPRNMTLSVHSQNVSASGIPALPNPEMLWDGVNTATNRLMQGESLQAKFQQSYKPTASDGVVTGKGILDYKQTAYWKKHKWLRKYAWAALGLGVCGTVVGWIGEAGNTAHTNSNWKEDGKVWDVVLVAGIGLTASSIPLFVFSHKNKRKAKETVEFSFRSSNIHWVSPNGMKQAQRVLGLCISF